MGDTANCFCDPSNAQYNEEDAKWRVKTQMKQHINIKAADVGEITQVTVTGDNEATDSWTPSFFKINTNTQEDGVGNGIFYIEAGGKINKDSSLTKQSAPPDGAGGTLNPQMADPATHGWGIIRCQAAVCEKRMEARLAHEEK